MKKALSLLLAALMVISLAACGSAEPAATEAAPAAAPAATEAATTKAAATEAAPAEAAPAAEPIEIEFWATGSYPDTFYYTGPIVEDWNALYGDRIHVNYVSTGGSTEESITKWQLAAANNQLPDILEMNCGLYVDQFREAGALADMAPYLGDDFTSRFSGEQLDAVGVVGVSNYYTKEGQIVAFPCEAEIQGWYYNTELFEKAGAEIPTTFDELLAAVEKFKAAGITPIIHGCTDNWATWGYYSWFHRLGLGLNSENYDKLIDGEVKAADLEPLVKTFTYMKQLHDAGAYNENAATTSNAQAFEEFLAGNAAMYTVGSWKMKAMNESPIADKIAFNYGPEFSDGVFDKMGGQRPFSWCLAFGSKATESEEKAKAVAEFVTWWVSAERAQKEAIDYGHFPVVPVDTAGLELEPVTKLTLDAMAADMIPFTSAYTARGAASYTECLNDTITGIIAGALDVQGALDNYQKWADETRILE